MDVTVEVGRLVKVLRGKDDGGFAVIIDIVDDRFVMIADGNKRRFDQPKKKNILHLELMPVVSSVVADSISETGRVTNAKLRFAIQKYCNGKENDSG